MITNKTLKKTALVSALMLELTAAGAATIAVDGTTCTLNDAIAAANNDVVSGGCTAGSGDDVLELPAEGLLNTSATLEINSNVTINGNGSVVQPDPGLPNGHRMINAASGVGVVININDLHLQNGGEVGNNIGGIRVNNYSTLNVNRSSVTNMIGGGIVFQQSSGSVMDTVISNTGNGSGNYYGGPLTISNGTLVVTNSTITANNNTDLLTGGSISVNGYYGGSDLLVVNSTISGNTSNFAGGGISVTGYGNVSSITLQNVSIVNNTSSGDGGGIYNDDSDFIISQSIIAGNTATGGTEINSVGGSITVSDYNVFGHNSNSGVVGVTVGASDIVPTETLTDVVDLVLADNGGPTQTLALPAGSPAIDAVPAASCAMMDDQTGKDRPIDGDVDGTADCDIGAFENANPDIIFKSGFD